MSYFGKKNEKNIESSSSDEEVALLTCQDISTSKYVNKGASQSSLYKNNYVSIYLFCNIIISILQYYSNEIQI